MTASNLTSSPVGPPTERPEGAAANHPSGALAGEISRDVALPAILIVEDDAMSADLIRRLLVKLGLANPVFHASDGAVALEWLAARLAFGERPPLLLLDVYLPKASGLEVLRWVRRQPALATVPVVMLTGSAELDQINEAYRLGISSYLVKPVGFEAIAETVRGLPTRWALLAPRSPGG